MNETCAPPCSRFSAQMRPPWASTMPRAIARPRPVPDVAAGAVGAPEAVEHALGRVRRRGPRRCPRRARARPSSRCSTQTATEPSDGVWRSAFVSRLKSTRSIFAGRDERRGLAVERRPTSSILPRRRLGLEEPQRRVDEVRRPTSAAARASARRSRSARARTGRRRAPRASAPGRASSAGTRPARRGRPRSPRASPASRRSACAGRGSPRRRARAARRRAARGSRPSC